MSESSNLALTLLSSQGDVFVLPAQCDAPSSPPACILDTIQEETKDHADYPGVECVSVYV